VSTASSQAQVQGDGAMRSDVVVGEFPLVHHFALVDETLLAHRDPLSLLHPALEVAHRLIRFDVIRAAYPLVVFEEHLDYGWCGHQQVHPGPGVQAVGLEGRRVVVESCAAAVLKDQLLGLT